MRERLRIGEVADLLGISANAVRYYQEIGLVPEPERSENGYRLYGAQDLLLLQRVRRLRSMGLSIEVVRHVLGEPEGEEARLRAALETLAEDTEARVVELKSHAGGIRETLDRFLALAHRLVLSAFSPVQKRAAELLRIRKEEIHGEGDR